MTELKPCPFCGGEAKYDNGGNGSFAEWYYCTSCGASTGRVRAVRRAAWNRRAAGWVSVEERLPEDDRQVLCYNGSYRFVGFLSNRKNIGWINTSKLQEASCTHWMPLPEPPEDL